MGLLNSVNEAWTGIAQIVQNDTKHKTISRELKIQKPLFNICVGVWERKKNVANFPHISKDTQENSSWGRLGKYGLNKKRTKNGNNGGENSVG